MISFAEAQLRIIAACEPLGAEAIALVAALDRVLASDVCARDNLVPFARSAMDGFAVRAVDTQAGPVLLPVGETIHAASGVPALHRPSTATAVATGAPLPLGADAVLPMEDVELEGGSVRVSERVRSGKHVFPPGDDALAGDLLVAAGAALGPGALALLAAAGYATLGVVRRPRVAIVCSGEELVRVDETPGYGQIRNSNATLVAATTALLGADVVSNVQARDDVPTLRAELERAFSVADLVITTGGASVGERDYIKPLLRELGVVFEFESVALRPARPTGFGRYGTACVAILAGNPAATFVALHELVRPALFRLAGRSERLLLPRVTARLLGELHAKANRTYLPFVRVRATTSGLVAIPLGNQCSALTRTASDANGFAVVEGASGDLSHGDLVSVDVYDWAGVGEFDACDFAETRVEAAGTVASGA